MTLCNGLFVMKRYLLACLIVCAVIFATKVQAVKPRSSASVDLVTKIA